MERTKTTEKKTWRDYYILHHGDAEFWHKVKIVALKRHTSIKELILDFLKNLVEKDEKK